MAEQNSVPYLVPDLAPGEVHTAEIVVQRSKFIVTLARASDPQAAKEVIERVRQAHRNATHNCWAYAVGAPGDTAFVGSSDDGEPQGTAGRPMLTVLLHSGVGELVAVVTRYFGGILLGTGGLVRAYQGAVKAGLETLPTKQQETGIRVLVSVDLSLAEALKHKMATFGAVVLSSDYRWDASFEVRLPASALEAFTESVASLTSGEGLVDVLEDD